MKKYTIITFICMLLFQAHNLHAQIADIYNADDLSYDELAIDGKRIQFNMTGGAEFSRTGDLLVDSVHLHNAPNGIIVTKFRATDNNSGYIDLELDPHVDFDTDYPYFFFVIDTLVLTVSDSVPSDSMYVTANIERSTFTPNKTLTESSIKNDGTTVLEVDLQNFEEFIDHNDLVPDSFLLVGFPDSVRIIDVVGTNDTHAELEIIYTPGDFDATYNNARVSIPPGALVYTTGAPLLTDNNETVTAYIESAAVISAASSGLDERYLDDGVVVIALSNDTAATLGAQDPALFELLSFPNGVSLESVSATHVDTFKIQLAFDKTNMNADASTCRIKIRPGALTYNKLDSLETPDFTIAYYEENPFAELVPDAPWPLHEYDMDGRVLTVSLSDEWITDTAAFKNDISLVNEPGGLNIDAVEFLDSTEFYVTLDYTYQDLDDSIVDFRLSMLDTYLYYSTSTLESDTTLIRVRVEAPKARISQNPDLEEYNIDGQVIQMSFHDEWIKNAATITIADVSLVDAPAGVSINSILKLDSNLVQMTLSEVIIDFDQDTFPRVKFNHLDLVQQEGTDLVSDSLPTRAYVETPVAYSTPGAQFREYWLDTNTVRLVFEEEKFINSGTLDAASFGLYHAPPGLTVKGISNASDSAVTVALGFNPPVDFDITYDDVRVTIAENVLIQTESDSLRSQPFTILPNLEPVVEQVSIPNDTMKIGDVVPVTIEIAFASDSTFTLVSGRIAGYDLFDLSKSTDTTYSAKFTVGENQALYLSPANIPVTNLRLDDDPLIGETYGGFIVQDADLLDSYRPVIGSLDIIPGVNNKQIGDDVILLISAFEDDLSAEDSTTINLEPLTESWVQFDQLGSGGGTYTLTYTIQPDDQNVDTGMLETRIFLRDPAGNVNDTFPLINPNILTIDADAPSIISVTNTTGAPFVSIGDTLELTVISDGTDYSLTEDSRVNGIRPEHGLMLEGTGPVYYVKYRVSEGDDPVLTPGALQARITLQDQSGNESPTATSIIDNTILVYATRPTATLTGTDEICFNDTATLFVNLTGIAPWDISYSDGSNSYDITGIASSPHTIKVKPLTDTDFMLDTVFDASGNSNSGQGISAVVVNPLPTPEITNLDNVYALDDPNEYELIGDPAGGVFSGPGVSNPQPLKYIFKPSVSGLTEGIPHVIKYEYTDNNGCYEDTTQEVNIVEADVTYEFQKPDQWACYLDDRYTIVVTNTSESNGTFTVLPGPGTPAFDSASFYEESWDPVNKTDTLIIHPSVFAWGSAPFNESHDFIIEYRYVNSDGVTVKAKPDEVVEIEYFETARVISDVGTTIDEFCSADNARQIRGTYEESNARFYGPGIVDLGGAAYQFDPERADTGMNLVYYEYIATHGCVQRDSTTITVYQTPAPRLARIDSCLATGGSDIRFINVSDTAGLGGVQWTWNFGDLATGPLNTTVLETMDTVFHFYQNLGTYTVTLSAEVQATGCQQDPGSNLNFEIYNFGNTPSPTLSWTTECDKGASIPVVAAKGTVDEVSNYHWLIRDPSGNTVVEDNGAGLGTLDFNYPQRAIYDIELEVSTTTGCVAAISDQIHLRPYFQGITVEDPVLEDFELLTEGWSADAQTKGENNSWRWETPGIGQFPHSAVNLSSSWFTHLDEKAKEQSYVISPCFDFEQMRRPMVRLDYRSISDRDLDGAVLQYTIDNGANWNNVGEINDGSINWYNSFRIQEGPGNQGEGWTGPFVFDPEADWTEGRHDLDVLVGQSTAQFRVAYSNLGTSEVPSKGFAFDNFWIGERTRIVLLEHFTNSGVDGISEKDNAINDLVWNNRLDVIDLHYHTQVDGLTDPLNLDNPAPASARSLFYGTRTTPYTLLDGGVQGSMVYDYEEENLDTLDLYTRALTDPSFDLTLNETSTATQIDINVDIKALEDMPDGEYILYLAIVEKDVDGFQNVVRDMVPSTAGSTLLQSWTRGETKSLQLNYAIADLLLGKEDLFIVTFIQDASSKLIYQAASNDLDLNGNPTPVSSGGLTESLLSGDLELMVYPNPARQEAFIAFATLPATPVELQIFSYSGALAGNELLPAGIQLHRFDVSALPEGLYFIRAIQDGRVMGTVKLVIDSH